MTEREVKIPKGDVLHQFREDVENGQLANRIMDGSAGKFFRSSFFCLVWRLVYQRSDGYTYKESGSLEEDHFYSYL